MGNDIVSHRLASPRGPGQVIQFILLLLERGTNRGRDPRGCSGGGLRTNGECQPSVPLVIKEPFLLSAEEPLEVESQRRRGSDSSTKKPLFLSRGDGSTVRSVEFSSFVLGLGIGLGLSGLGFTGRASLSVSSCGKKQAIVNYRVQNYRNFNGPESEKEYICVCVYINTYITESLCCTPETNRIWSINSK